MHEWRDSAACRGMDTDLFFSGSPIARGRALAACRGCPVSSECLSDALRYESGSWANGFHGIRGGLPAAQRRNLARKLRDAAAR